MRQLVAFILLFAVFSCVNADTPEAQYQAEAAAASLVSSVLYLSAHDLNDNDQISGLIIALGLLKTAQSDRALVSLADYYLGESVDEDMTAVITHRGRPLLALLRAKLLHSPECVSANKCLPRLQRDERVMEWIKSIESGQRVEFNQ